MISRYSGSESDTQALASQLARLCGAGDLILLVGGIGAGKTTFVQGFARALDVTERVTSPSFVLQHLYASGRLLISHIDLYRLETDVDVAELGIDDYSREAVTLIEWGDRYNGFAPPLLEISFGLAARNGDRLITLTPHGSTWDERLLRIDEATGEGQ